MSQNALPLELGRASKGSRTGHAWPHFLWYAGVLVAMLGAMVSLARLVDFMWAGHYHKIFIPAIMMLALMLIVGRRMGPRVDALGLCLMAIIFLGTVVGFLHGGEVRYFLAHFAGAVFGFLLYVVSRDAQWDEEWLETFWKISSYLILLAFVVSIGAFWAIRLVMGTDLYLGIGTGDLVFPLAYFLVYKKYRYATITLLLFLLSGKRGPLVSALAVILFYLPLPGRSRLLLRVTFVTGCAMLIVLASFIAEPLVRSVALPSFVSEILDKWYQANFLNDSFNIDHAFSGRNQELVLSFGTFGGEAHHWLIGMGYGWSYFFDAVIVGSTTTNFRSHYVHMSPANLVLLYGIPLTLLLVFFMWRNISKVYRYSGQMGQRPMLRVLVLFWIGAFVTSLSGYSYPTDPMFWLALGTVVNLTQRSISSRASDESDFASKSNSGI